MGWSWHRPYAWLGTGTGNGGQAAVTEKPDPVQLPGLQQGERHRRAGRSEG